MESAVAAGTEHVWIEICGHRVHALRALGACRGGDCKEEGRRGGVAVLVHGVLGSSASFGTCMRELSLGDFDEVWAVDLPGFGRTHWPLSSDPLSLWVEFLRLFMDAVCAKHATVLVGHSLGGFVAAHFALKYPQRVGRLVLVSPAGMLPTLGGAGFYWAHAFHAPLLGLVRSLARVLGGLPFLLSCSGTWQYWFAVIAHPLGWGDRAVASFIEASWTRARWTRPFFDHLSSVAVPVVTVFGEQDPLTPMHQGVLLRHTHGIPCAVVANAGHVPLGCAEVCETIQGKRGAVIPRRSVGVRGDEFWARFESLPSVWRTRSVLCGLYRALLGWDEFL